MLKRTFSRWPVTFSPVAALLALLLATLACASGTPPATALPPPPLPAGQPTATPRPLRGTPAAIDAPPRADPFAPYVLPGEEAEHSEVVPAYSLDLELVENADTLSDLSKPQRDALIASGFVVLPTTFRSFSDLFRETAEQDLPLFVTVDAATHALDLLGDVARLRAEQTLAADLEALSQALVATTLAQWQAAPNEATASAAWRNLAFFAVGHRLQAPQADLPPAVAEIVHDELTLIEEGGTFLSPLLEVTRDYGRFQPAGHYARDPLLARYYRALIWYAHPFSLDTSDVTATRGVARQLLLLASALHTSENYSRWQHLYRALAYLRGTAPRWSVETVSVAADALYGQVPPVTGVADPAALDDFVATMQAYPQSVALPPPSPATFRFLPAPELPDRPWLDTFVFNRVGGYTGSNTVAPLTLVETTAGPVRGLPRVLDLAAAQGSPVAFGWLDAEHDTAYTGYETQLESARAHLALLDQQVWTQTWAGGWHYGLQPLLAEPSPLPFSDTAWEAKTLNSWYGAWVRLHTPTTLSPRPVASEVPVVGRAGYVEPYPALYARMAALARQLHAGLDQYRLLDEEIDEKLLRLERLLLAFQAIAVRELNGEPFTEDQRLVLRQAGTRLENLLTFAPPGEGSVPLTERNIAQIVDVYPSPGGDELLQAGVGGIWPVYVLVPVEEQLVVAVGGVFATYALRVGQQEKWDVGTWPAPVEAVAPAGWTDAFLAP